MPCSLLCTNCPDPSPPIPSDYSIPGFGIQRNCRNAEWALVIRTAQRQEDWVAFRPRVHAFDVVELDTAIRYQGRLYRIMAVEQKPSGWTYRLVEWPPGENFREIVDLSPEAIAQVRAERQEREHAARLSVWAPFYEFLFGFLPSRLQDRLSERFCFDPAEASRRSGAIQFMLFFVLTVLAADEVLGHAHRDYVKAGVLSLSLAMEGALRWVQAGVSGRPIGFLPLELIDWLVPHHDAAEKAKP